ncbi:hypothetical protein DFH11DRAFT_678562 [Phellopilus nigrolimitatus]|nr:hypothetical protein DFH11DRAFT_678562 [Phellopilus nigrolimitatus]
MARPLSNSSMTYDPYSYYRDSSSLAPSSSSSSSKQYRERSCPVVPRHSRPASIWSTSSICSDDSSLDDRVTFAFDAAEDDDLTSPVSPAESTSSRVSWSSAASSSSSASRYNHSSDPSSSSMPAPLTRFKRSDRPRGPRPLPALPTSQPPSPVSPSPRRTTLPLPKVTPPLKLNLKVVTPPPSYEEAISAGVCEADAERGMSMPFPLLARYPFDAEASPNDTAEFLTSPAEETLIDWARIEEFIAQCDM